MKLNTLYIGIVSIVLLSGCSSENPQSSPASDISSDPVDANAENPANTNVDQDAQGLRVLFLGDSITAGYGLGEDQAFPALIQTQLTENGYSARAVNAGISGDTSTGGLTRLDWLLRDPVDVLILELGGNDGLRGVDLELTRSNLESILRKTKEVWPNAALVVAGMMIPPNLGHEYTAAFSAMYPVIAEQFDAAFIPFTLEGLEGIGEHMQPDGIHPTEEGHRIIAAALWETLEPLIKQLS